MVQLRKKILCIEDDRETAKLIAEELLQRGFHPLIAYDGRLGLAAIQKRIPDLVLCDVSLPEMSGFEILANLNESDSPARRIPFVFLTGATDRYSELQGRTLGADDYLSKPIDFDILEIIIRTRLAGGIARHQMGNLPEPGHAAPNSAARRAFPDEVVEVIDAPTFHFDLDRPLRGVAAQREVSAKDAHHRQREDLVLRRFESRMCGRLAQDYTWNEVRSLYGVVPPQAEGRISAHHAIFPTETIDTIRQDRDTRILEPMRWGLIPGWWKLGVEPTNPAAFNARADIVAASPLFQSSFTRRHCLIPTSGFYGMNRDGERCYFTRRDGSVMTIAGLWDEWRKPDTGELVRSCAIVVDAPGKSNATEINQSLPIIMEPKHFEAWLSSKACPDLMKPAGEAVTGRRLTWKLVEEI